MLSGQAEINSFNNKGEIFTTQLSYWQQRLAGAPPILELPGDNAYSIQTTRSIHHFNFSIPADLKDELKKLGGLSESHLSTVLLGAFNVLLYRYTNQEDILVGYDKSEVITNVDESGSLVSSPFNKIILRTDLSGDPGFSELLMRIRTRLLEDEGHADLPFDALVQSLGSGGFNMDSLFQVGYQFLGTGHLQTKGSQEGEQSLDLRLCIEENPGGLNCQWDYSARLFTEDMLRRMAGHYQQLLSGMVANPRQPISRLPILSAAERMQILFEWNNTQASYPLDKCIHELFEEQARRTPGAVAVELYEVEGDSSTFAETKLTYHQLNARANQVAHYLREQGVGPDVLAGICMKRSVEMMVGLLGILKAGGAYLPLDPGYPRERLQFMLQDSGVGVLLTQAPLVPALPLHQAQVLCLDRDWEKIGASSNKNPDSGVKPENLAYVIYTSGSTGIPKGTLINHRGVVNYLSWCIREYAVEAGSGAPVNSSIAFDATVTSFFSPLLVGRRVLLLPEKEEIEALRAVLDSGNGFSLVKITPAHLEILQHLQEGHPVDGHVNAVVIGGESLLTKSLEMWRKHAPGTRLINEYGPTETVVGCCTYEVKGDNLVSEEVPIGRPIANMQLYILDRHLQPVPIGVSGEIHIGGAGLARGYLNRPALTGERFIPNPFSEDANARLYKTGDLARYLGDGNIVFQGRIDQQVKIRGYRIELGEIESVLSKHPSVQQVTVIAREDNAGDKKLVAYLVSKEQVPAGSELRLYLGEKLPEYMVPALFVFLKSLPLTSNGKVDRSALPVPDQQVDIEKTWMAPRNRVEEQLVEIFQKCLHIPRVGVRDDFFELGGSSMQAAVIFSQIRKMFGKQLPLITLIQSPTIEKLADSLNEKAGTPSWSSLVPIQPNGTKPPLFCIHGGLGNVLFYRHLSKHLGTEQPLYGLQAKGLNGIDSPFEDLEEMAASYIREIRKVQPVGPYYLAGYCFGAIVAFEMAQQLQLQNQEIAFLGSFNGVAPTDPETNKISSIRKMFPVVTAKDKLLYPVRMGKFILRGKLLSGYSKILNKVHDVAYKFYQSRGLAMPDALGRNYVVDAIGRAQNAYKPRTYPGRLIIFRSPNIYKNPHLRWTRLIAGGIATHDMPGDYKDRKYIMFEPFVQHLAESLKNYLANKKNKD